LILVPLASGVASPLTRYANPSACLLLAGGNVTNFEKSKSDDTPTNAEFLGEI
jgi:hypothetical protein